MFFDGETLGEYKLREVRIGIVSTVWAEADVMWRGGGVLYSRGFGEVGFDWWA